MIFLRFTVAFITAALGQIDLMQGISHFEYLEKLYDGKSVMAFPYANSIATGFKSNTLKRNKPLAITEINLTPSLTFRFESVLIQDKRKIPIYAVVRNSEAVYVLGFPSRPHVFDYPVLLTLSIENLSTAKADQIYFLGDPSQYDFSGKLTFSYRAIYKDLLQSQIQIISRIVVHDNKATLYNYKSSELFESIILNDAETNTAPVIDAFSAEDLFYGALDAPNNVVTPTGHSSISFFSPSDTTREASYERDDSGKRYIEGSDRISKRVNEDDTEEPLGWRRRIKKNNQRKIIDDEEFSSQDKYSADSEGYLAATTLLSLSNSDS